MRQTNPKKFRAELKDYLDMATKEPIRIQRQSGGSFIILAEESYQELLSEVMSLQRRLLAMTEIVSGNVEEFEPQPRKRNKKRD